MSRNFGNLLLFFKEIKMSISQKLAKSNVLSIIPVLSNVPLKHRSNCPTARHLCEHILLTEDFSDIKRSMLLNGVCRTTERADQLIKAWVQWFSVGSTSITKSFIMLSGSIDKTFHQALLNTKWYFKFCYTHSGVYTHHDPLTDEQLEDISWLTTAVEDTVRRLEKAFGDDLHPELQKWGTLFKSGKISPRSVSCVSNGGPFDIVPRSEV